MSQKMRTPLMHGRQLLQQVESGHAFISHSICDFVIVTAIAIAFVNFDMPCPLLCIIWWDVWQFLPPLLARLQEEFKNVSEMGGTMESPVTCIHLTLTMFPPVTHYVSRRIWRHCCEYLGSHATLSSRRACEEDQERRIYWSLRNSGSTEWENYRPLQKVFWWLWAGG